jgi:hypothetical protein
VGHGYARNNSRSHLIDLQSRQNGRFSAKNPSNFGKLERSRAFLLYTYRFPAIFANPT